VSDSSCSTKIPLYEETIAPYKNVPQISFYFETREKNKWIFYATRNGVIVKESKQIYTLPSGYNEVFLPINTNIEIGDLLGAVVFFYDSSQSTVKEEKNQ